MNLPPKSIAHLRRAGLRQARLVEVLLERDVLAPSQLERHSLELVRIVRLIGTAMSQRRCESSHLGDHVAQEEGHPDSVWEDTIDQIRDRMRDLEALISHQEAMGLPSCESRGQLAAYRRVLDCFKHETPSTAIAATDTQMAR